MLLLQISTKPSKSDLCVFPEIPVRWWYISVVSKLIKLKFSKEVEDTHISIIRKNHNDNSHDKNASEK